MLRIKDVPNVVQLLALGRVWSGGAECEVLVTPEYRCSLEHALKNTDMFASEASQQHLMRRLTTTLFNIHSCGIVHLDVKPANILITEEGEPALADFGVAHIAKQPSSGHFDVQEILMTIGCGTGLYISPDMYSGQFSPHVDCWSLGITQVELMLGGKLHTLFPGGVGSRHLFWSKLVVFLNGGNLEGHLKDTAHGPATARDFIAACCGLGPYEREGSWSAERLLQHPWLGGRAPE